LIIRLFFFYVLTAFLPLIASETSAQNKSYDDSISIEDGTASFTRLQLATNLGISRIRYTLLDTMVVDSNIEESITPSIFDSSSNLTIIDTSVVIIKQKSALTAVFLSAVIPGGGQIYNRSYWKVPIIYGLEAFFVSQWISNNRSYQSLRAQWQDSLNANANPGIVGQLQDNRDAYHDQRDSYAWYMAGVYVLSVLDAYIDAELSGFDVSPSLGFAPDGSSSAAICIRVNFQPW